MAKLSDIQHILLTTAAARPGGSLLPAPEKCGDLNARLRMSITALIGRGLVEETVASKMSSIWREKDGQYLGVFISAAGHDAIGVPAEGARMPAHVGATLPSKISIVIAMLRRDGGTTLAEISEATGWLPHTTRAALTGLRKKGHDIRRGSRDGISAYAIAAA